MRRRCGLSIALLVLLAAPVPARADTVQLVPDEQASWGLRNVTAPLTALFLGPGYWYGPRTVEVETSPPGANLDLFYVRANFQRRYEQATAPVTIVLPRRIEAGPRDSVTVRAFLEGYRFKDTTLRVDDRTSKLVLELDPLPNHLRAVSHTYFAGRSTLGFLTTQPPVVRVQRRAEGFTVVLNETGAAPELSALLDAIHSPLVSRVAAQQVGEDLLVRLDLSDEARARNVELRSREEREPARDLSRFTIDLAPPGGAAETVARVRAALSRLAPGDVTGCALVFEDALRQSLDPAALARALAPRGDFVDPVLRAAMRRLGELSPEGVVPMRDGARYRTADALELEAALSEASQARGFVALLRGFARELGGAAAAAEELRGLVAPELGESAFADVLTGADAAERGCRAGGRAARSGPTASAAPTR